MRLHVSFEADVSPLDQQLITAIVNIHYDHLAIAAQMSRNSVGRSIAREDADELLRHTRVWADEAFAGLGPRVTFAA